MNTQSIIIYRNPLEQQMWEALMSGNMFPIIAGVLVFFIVFLTLNKFVVEKFFTWRTKGIPTNIALGVSAISGILTIYLLAIA